MKATTRREQQAAGTQQSHCAKVDLLVAADRGRYGASRFREGGRIEDDRIEPVPGALSIPQIIERVSFDGFDVRHPIEREILLRALERGGGTVECDDAFGIAREVERERSVIAEAVERLAPRALANEG